MRRGAGRRRVPAHRRRGGRCDRRRPGRARIRRVASGRFARSTASSRSARPRPPSWSASTRSWPPRWTPRTAQPPALGTARLPATLAAGGGRLVTADQRPAPSSSAPAAARTRPPRSARSRPITRWSPRRAAPRRLRARAAWPRPRPRRALRAGAPPPTPIHGLAAHLPGLDARRRDAPLPTTGSSPPSATRSAGTPPWRWPARSPSRTPSGWCRDGDPPAGAAGRRGRRRAGDLPAGRRRLAAHARSCMPPCRCDCRAGVDGGEVFPRASTWARTRSWPGRGGGRPASRPPAIGARRRADRSRCASPSTARTTRPLVTQSPPRPPSASPTCRGAPRRPR